MLAVGLAVLMSCAVSRAAVLAPPVQISAQTPVVALAGASEFLVDPGGRLGIDDIEARRAVLPFAVRPPGHTVLLTDGAALWIRFALRWPEPAGHWRLEVALPGVDAVALYHRDAAGRWIEQRAGDSLPQSLWPQHGRLPVLDLGAQDGLDMTYYLRVQHERVPFSGALSVKSETRVAEQLQRAQFLLGAYFGLAALALFVALANAVVYRDRGFGAYVLYISTMVLAQAGFTGVGGMLLWPESPGLNNPMTFYMPLVAGATGVWFVRTVTSPRQYSILLDRLTVGMLVVVMAVASYDVVWPSAAGFDLSMKLLTLSMVLVLVLLGVAVARGDRHSRWIAAGFSLMILGGLFPMARNLGLMSSGFLSEYGLMLGSAVEMALLFYGLNRRLNEQTESRARARALSFMDPLTGLSSRSAFLARLQAAITRSRKGRPFAMMVIELANLQALARGSGADGADRPLVLAASRLKRVVRDFDTVARVDSHHFAVLMESPCTPDEANAIATHVVAQGLRESDALSDGATLRFHIALAMLPLAEMNAEATLHELMHEISLITTDSRKTIRLVKS